MKILVTGAGGNIGRHVVSLLVEQGVDVRAMVRDPTAADLPPQVQVVRGDLTDPASLARAAEGTDTAFLLWPFFTAEAAPAAAQALAKHARRLVYVSAMSVDDEVDSTAHPEANGVWGQVEQAIENSAAGWTFLRAGGLAVNTLGWADQIREGVVRWPYGQAARSLVHEKDVAAVAARALTEDRHEGAKYVLTGPAALSQAEQVRLIGEAIGRPVSWQELPPEQAREMLLAEWGDASFVDGALNHWASLVDAPEPVTDTVERVTGAPARSFREWAADHADDFR